jgi:hypothetical protein
MKRLLAFSVFFIAANPHAQILYDPTVVHDSPGQLYDIDNINTLEVNFYDTWYHDTLKYWKANYIENTLPAQLDYGATHFDSVAVKYKGNSTFGVADLFNNPKMPYNIDLNEYVGGQDIQGNKKLKLGNALFDPSFAKEILASHVYKQYMPCYEANLIKLFVNGSYLGLYTNQEDIGPPFLKKHFGEKDGAFFKCEPMTEEQAGHPVPWPTLLWNGTDTLDYYEIYERKSDSGWVEFLNMIYVLNNDIANIEQVINVDRVLWNFAVSTVLSNEDTYNTTIIHNYYMYQTGDGKFQMIPWDLTESFCGLLFTTGTPQSHYELEPLYGLNPYMADRPLVYQLLSNNYYRKRYFAHIRTVIEEYYTAADLKAWTMDVLNNAYYAVLDDPNKLFTMAEHIENVDNPINWLIAYTIAGMTDVVNNRKPYLLSHADVIKVAPVINSVTQNIQHPSFDETVYVSAAVNNATSVKLRVTNNPANYASDFQSVTMLDNGLGGDAAAGDGIFTAPVPFTATNDHVKYYIEAENAEALALMPERAEYFYYHYYVDQVVGETEIAGKPVSIYPNPASEYVIVDGTSASPYTVTFYDIAGKVVYAETNAQGKQKIDCSAFPRGVYIAEIISNDADKHQDRETIKIVLN